MIAPEKWEQKCSACGEPVSFKKGFACTAKPGNHIVPEVRFYHMGGRDIKHPREKRSWAPTLTYIRPKIRDISGNLIDAMPLEVHFGQGGILDTNDAETIFWLQTRSTAVGWGEDGRKTWERVYLSEDQQVAIAQNRLADLNRQIEEKNELLDSTKARVAGTAVKAKPVGATA